MITCGKIINMWTLFEKRNKWGTNTVFFAPARLVLLYIDLINPNFYKSVPT